jgi:hypothetical protein
MFRSLLAGRVFVVILEGGKIDKSTKSPVLLAPDMPDDDIDSPDIDLCSSSPLESGEFGIITLERSEHDKSSGESLRGKN